MIKFNSYNGSLPLYRHFANDVQARPACVYFNLSKMELRAESRAGNGMTSDEANNREVRFSIHNRVHSHHLNELLASSELHELCEELAEKWTDDAYKAKFELGFDSIVDDIQALIDREIGADALTSVTDPEDHFAEGRIDDDNVYRCGDMSITADTTDDQIDDLIDREEISDRDEEIDCVIWKGAQFLIDIRDELIANRNK